MFYRPEYKLHRLRLMTTTGGAEGTQETTETAANASSSVLCLPWLRTVVIDFQSVNPVDVSHRWESQLEVLHRSRVSSCAIASFRVAQYRSAAQYELGSAVEDPLGQTLIQICSRKAADPLFYCLHLPQLTKLDLRGFFVPHLNFEQFFVNVAQAHPHLKRLFLPQFSFGCSQRALNGFTNLEELDVSSYSEFCSVDFCAATLRVLYANRCFRLTNEGLRMANKLQVLHVLDCQTVTDVSPFAHCLLELDASGTCGLGSDAIADCTRLQVLYAGENMKIHTVSPFPLRELRCGGQDCRLDDASLAECSAGLVGLDVSWLPKLTTLVSCSATLRELMIGNGLGIVNADAFSGLTNLVTFRAMPMALVPTFAPFAASLLQLSLLGVRCSDDSSSWKHLNQLQWLQVAWDDVIVSTEPFRKSMRHLFVSGSSALCQEELAHATHLVTLVGPVIPLSNLATHHPDLEELYINEPMRMKPDVLIQELLAAKQLRSVKYTVGSTAEEVAEEKIWSAQLVSLEFEKIWEACWFRDRYSPTVA